MLELTSRVEMVAIFLSSRRCAISASGELEAADRLHVVRVMQHLETSWLIKNVKQNGKIWINMRRSELWGVVLMGKQEWFYWNKDSHIDCRLNDMF